MDESEFFKTGIHVCHYILTFSNLILFECYSEWIGVYFRLRWVHLILFQCCLSIQLFWYLRCHILLQKILSFPCYPLCWYVLMHSPLFAGRIFFCCFKMSYFVGVVLFFLFSLPSFACNFWFIYSCCIFWFNCYVAFLFSSKPVLTFFPCFIIFFSCCSRFLCFLSNFPSRFWVSVRVFRGTLTFIPS